MALEALLRDDVLFDLKYASQLVGGILKNMLLPYYRKLMQNLKIRFNFIQISSVNRPLRALI